MYLCTTKFPLNFGNHPGPDPDSRSRGATMLRSWGDQGLGSNTGAPRARPKAGLGVGCRGGVAPSCCDGPGASPPEKFLKTQMLNPAFWWLLAVKFLAFWKLRPRSWGTNTVVAPMSRSDWFRLYGGLYALRVLSFWVHLKIGPGRSVFFCSWYVVVSAIH